MTTLQPRRTPSAMRGPATELAALEDELRQPHEHVRRADEAAVMRKAGVRGGPTTPAEDSLPLRDRVAVLERKIARLKSAAE